MNFKDCCFRQQFKYLFQVALDFYGSYFIIVQAANYIIFADYIFNNINNVCIYNTLIISVI